MKVISFHEREDQATYKFINSERHITRSIYSQVPYSEDTILPESDISHTNQSFLVTKVYYPLYL